MIGDEYKIHRAKYENWGWTWRSYDEIKNGVEKWIEERPAYFLRHLKDFYGIEDIKTGIFDNPHNALFDINNDVLSFYCEDGLRYQISDLQGVVRQEEITEEGKSKTISLPKGLYLLSIKGNTYKFIIKE